MSLPLSSSEQNLYESLNAPCRVGGAPGDENIRLNEERSIIASTIALHGVQAVADGDVKYITDLLNRAAELTDTTVPIYKFLKITNEDGYSMLHAAVFYKNVEIMELIFDYGNNTADLPTKDKFEDTPLTLAVKNFELFHNPSAKMRSSINTCLPISIQIVQSLLAIGANVNGANAKGDTPLILAAKLQNAELVTQICKSPKLEINKRNGLGKSALHYAAGSNNTEIAMLLLDHEASVLVEDREGYTPVHTACKYGREEVLQLMLNKRTEVVKELIERVTRDGKTPLLVAKSALNYSMHNIQTLIYTGSKLSAVDRYKNSILHLYSAKDDVSIHEYILDKEPSLLSLTNYNLETPLHITASYGYNDTCLFYMERGASFTVKDINNFTPFMRAIACGHLSVVKMFLEFDCKVDSIVKHQKTVLEWAIENGYDVLIEALCEHDIVAAFNEIYCNGLNIIELTAKIGQESTLQLLLQINAAKRLVDPKEHYARSLHIAVEHGHLNCVKVLFEECNNELTTHDKGNDDTPLHVACRSGHFEIVKYLLSQKPCTEISNLTEGTPLCCAAAQGHDMIVQYLLNNGASTSGAYYTSSLKVTPLLIAATNGHTNVVKILLQHDIEINLRNSCSRNFLCEAIINGHQSTVAAILNNDTYWRQAMQFRTYNNETPMRLLIKHMPEMAEMVLSRCVTMRYKTDDIGHRTPEHITYSFEFVDDFDVPYKSVKDFMRHIGLMQHLPKSLFPEQQSLDGNSFKLQSTLNNTNRLESDTIARLIHRDDNDDKWLQQEYESENHVLRLMVKHKRIDLLKHPVASELLKYKWNTYGLPVFIMSFILNVFFIILLTVTVCLIPLPQRDECRAGFNFTEVGCSDDINPSVNRFLVAALKIIIVLSALFICIKIFRFIRRRRSFVTDLSQWIAVCLYISSIIFVVRYKQTYDEDRCDCISKGTWRVGVIAVFLGWTTIISELKKFPITGITINMLSSITYTFFKLTPVAALLIFTFALPFYMLLAIPDQRTPLTFSNIGRSVLKTLVMTTGELDFDTIYLNDDDTMRLAYPIEFTILWVVFIIMMPILFSNLLVGLAVGDTQEELNKAELTKYKLRIRMVLELESTITILRCLYKISERTLYDKFSMYDWFRGSGKLDRRVARIKEMKNRDDFSHLLEGEETIDPMEKIEERISVLHNEHSERLDRMEALLKKLMMHFDDQDREAASQSDTKEMRKRALTLEAALSVKTKSDN